MSTIDHEVLDLLRARPELLRLAEAVTLTRPRRRRIPRPAVVAVTTAVAVGVVLVASWPKGGANVVDRALGAIGSGPVVHAVVERSSSADVVVNLATGFSYERVHATEFWYDRERSLLHTRLLTDGKMLTEIVETPTGSDSDLGHYPGGIAAQLDPALAGFVTHYREALANGTATITGHEKVDGRDVTHIRIPLGGDTAEDVAVDSDSYRPLFFTYVRGNAAGPRWRVAEIESIARDPSYFAKPHLSAPRPTNARTSSAADVTPTEAATALERPALWLGRHFGNLALTRISLSEEEVGYTDGSTHPGKRLEVTYGNASRRGEWVTIREAASVPGSYQLGFNDGGDPPAPEGSLVLQNSSIVARSGGPPPPVPEHGEWSGRLIADGMYVEVQASSRELLLAAVRALGPID